MTSRHVRAALGILAFLGILIAIFAIRTTERVGKQAHDDHEASKRFAQDFGEGRGK